MSVRLPVNLAWRPRAFGPIERFSDYTDGRFGNSVSLHVLDRHPLGRVGIRRAAELSTCRAAKKIHQNEVILHASIRVVSQTIENIDDRAHLDLETGLLADFA